MRKENVITLSDRGRDLTFKIREMPALQLERWVHRAVLLLGSAGLTVPEGAGFSQLGEILQSYGLGMLLKGMVNADYNKATVLLDELLGCCSIVIDRLDKRITTDMVNDHIEDWRTISRLRIEALKLNLGFSEGVGELSDSPENRLGVTA